MKVKKLKTVEIESDITFNGATLLSLDEAENFLTEVERMYSFCWWLRTPGYFSSNVCIVDFDGSILSNGDGADYYNGIRPALVISNLGDFKVGEMFNIGSYQFKIISPNLAWLYKQDIGEIVFGITNDYEKSHAKKVVDSWYETLLKEETI